MKGDKKGQVSQLVKKIGQKAKDVKNDLEKGVSTKKAKFNEFQDEESFESESKGRDI